jgi:hypothetical protein
VNITRKGALTDTEAGTVLERCMPHAKTGTEATKEARGPDAPMSKMILRRTEGVLMRMNAPSVPMTE